MGLLALFSLLIVLDGVLGLIKGLYLLGFALAALRACDREMRSLLVLGMEGFPIAMIIGGEGAWLLCLIA